MPATTRKANGEARQVGVEIEMHGIAVDRLAEVVQDALGGTVNKVSRSEYALTGEMLEDMQRVLHPVDSQWRRKIQRWADQS